MSERNDDPVRDVERTGDVGEERDSALADERRDGPSDSGDGRLGMRGRNTGRDDGELLDAVDADRESGSGRSEEREADGA